MAAEGVTRPFRFAVQGGPFGDPDALAEHARSIEAMGYEELWSADHLGGTDPFVPLVVAARATTTLRVGPLVLNNEFHNPALLARTVASVDRVTGGRLTLGLGTGYAEEEHTAIGSPIRPPGRRVTRFGESLGALRRLLDEGAATVDGAELQLDVADLGVRPVQERVPFLVGGHGRRVVRLAGRHADIYQFTGLVHGEGGAPTAGGFEYAQLLERAQWLREAAGDRDADIERSALVQGLGIDDCSTPESLAAESGLPVEAIDSTPFLLHGSRQQLIERLERYRAELGISHYVIRNPEGFAPIVEALAGR